MTTMVREPKTSPIISVIHSGMDMRNPEIKREDRVHIPSSLPIFTRYPPKALPIRPMPMAQVIEAYRISKRVPLQTRAGLRTKKKGIK